MKFIKEHKKIIILIITILVLLITLLLIYKTIYLDYKSNIELTLKGNSEITLNLNEEYKEEGYTASFRNIDITKKVEVKNNLDNKKVGEYKVEYTINYKKKRKKITRTIKVVDTISPTIVLNGEENISLYVGDTYNDEGASANDNYDGDLTDKIVVVNNLDTNKIGAYEIVYTVKDMSGNEASIKRKIEVKEKPVIKVSNGIAVLNYHFFYSDGENCGERICLNTRKFEDQLKYLVDNGYKTLTINEFRAWIYGELEVPQKSVLLTIDDGAMGTGFHNGNKLIPLLEKYGVHATLFLITGWWDINNYRSPNLDIESHTNDMHMFTDCGNNTKNAQLVCLDHDHVLNDLNKSIEITGSRTAFCYPFYTYNQAAIATVKEAGFSMAFAGGNVKATRNSNKYAIPRFPIYDNTSLETFINYIS